MVALLLGSFVTLCGLRLPAFREISSLACWREKMFTNLDRMRSLGLSERFLAMWEYYLSYCEGSFREHAIGVVQMRLERA